MKMAGKSREAERPLKKKASLSPQEFPLKDKEREDEGMVLRARRREYSPLRILAWRRNGSFKGMSEAGKPS